MRDVPTNATTCRSLSTVRRNRLQSTGSSATVGRHPRARRLVSHRTVRAMAIASATTQICRQSPAGIRRGSELKVDEGTILSLHEDDRDDERAERERADEPWSAFHEV